MHQELWFYLVRYSILDVYDEAFMFMLLYICIVVFFCEFVLLCIALHGIVLYGTVVHLYCFHRAHILKINISFKW